MTIIIGREPVSSSPRLLISVNEKNTLIGEPGSVPKTVSRRHCRLDISDDGSVTVTNIADANTLYVNGIEYKSKTLADGDMVELGPDRYAVDIQKVIAAAKSAPAPKTTPQQDAVNIKHLQSIWENYSKSKMDMQIKERKLGALSAIPGVISMISIALSFIPGLRVVFISVAALFAFAFAALRIKTAGKNPLKQKQMEEDFQDHYTCPKCGHFLGNQRYSMILKNGSCIYCKAKFIE